VLKLRRTWTTGWRVDLLCLGILVLSNPVLYFFNDSPNYAPPDSVAYVTFGRQFLSQFQLYIRSWGHVDSGLILPPLYPLLIAFIAPFAENLLSLAERISSSAILLACIPLYLLARRRAGPLVAVLATMAVQVNYAYCYMGLAPLTEALFILMISCSLLLLDSFLHHDRKMLGLGLGLGVFCALAFLARQIGVIVLPFCLLWIVMADLWPPRRAYRSTLRRLLLVVFGFLLVAGPYTSILYHQTGQSPFRQGFRLGIYEVGTVDPAVLSDIERIQARTLNGYDDTYAQRRQMRKLLPDGSEMYASLVDSGKRSNKDDASAMAFLLRYFGSPTRFASQLWDNIGHLQGTLGLFLVVLFLATAVTPFFAKSPTLPFPKRYMLAAFSLGYVAAISLITGQVARYIEVVLPFVLLHVFAEAYTIGGQVRSIVGIRYLPMILAAVVFTLGVALMPRHFNSLNLIEKPQVDIYRNEQFPKGEPIFSLSPFDAHVVRGWFRILPNDRLDKVVEYGRRTGVRWIVVSTAQNAWHEIRLYNHAAWYRGTQLHRRYSDLVELCCVFGQGHLALYRIKPARRQP
jgi:hypothetical protein